VPESGVVTGTPKFAPSMSNCTEAMPNASDALALTASVPLANAPDAGVTIDALGALVVHRHLGARARGLASPVDRVDRDPVVPRREPRGIPTDLARVRAPRRRVRHAVRLAVD